MGLTIDGVPESISRAGLMAAIESLGIDPAKVTSVTIGNDAVMVTVLATHPAHGGTFLVNDQLRAYDPDNEDNLSMFRRGRHEVTIPLV